MMNHSKNKNFLKKIILTLVIASLSVACFGCDKDNNTDDNSNSVAEDEAQETLSLEDAKWDLTFVNMGDENADSTESKEDANENDVTDTNTENTDSSSSDADSAKSSTAVTPDKPVAVTEVIEMTNESGQPVTDSKGTVQTEIVTVTEQVKVTDNAGQPVTDSAGTVQTEVVNVTEKPATEATQATEPITYTPSYDVCKSYWLDMSQEGDFFFEGEFLVFVFQVNDNTPDGNYPVTLKTTDIASWDVVKWEPVCINGEVAVNSNITAQEDAADGEFTLKVNSVSAKQGDMVTVAIDLSNNPGFCGFVLELEYDKSALQMIEAYSGADFGEAIQYLR